MTKSKEEMAKEYSHRFDKGNKFNTTNSGGAYFEELAFLAGYDARQAEVDELQKYIDTPNPMELLFAKATRETMCKFIKENDELKSEIQELKKDKERLDWMIEHSADVKFSNPIKKYVCSRVEHYQILQKLGQTPRDAIDDCIREESKDGK